MEWYKSKVGEKVKIPKSKIPYDYAIGMEIISENDNYLIPIEDLILGKDFVASLTDSRALLEHRKHFGTIGG